MLDNHVEDNWATGDIYEQFMGRWSRPLGRAFIQWLDVAANAHWLDVGCGTGALTAAICDLATPASVVACDPSPPFIHHARRHLTDARIRFQVADAGNLPHHPAGFDVIVSGLALNFFPDPTAALEQMRNGIKPGGVVAATVWDYAGQMAFLRIFWDTAISLDPAARQLDEGVRFPLCQPDALRTLFRQAGLSDVDVHPLQVPTPFASFQEYWRPFLGGTGPAPTYVASLTSHQQNELAQQLQQRLPVAANGAIQLQAQAWAVRGRRR